MAERFPQLYAARHGETAWTITGQHTGFTDLPLTPKGEDNARHLANRLRNLQFAAVYTSPLQRAKRTCELAGFGDRAEIDNNLVEWNYGEYEGMTTPEIMAVNPRWDLYRDGCPGGESADDVVFRARQVVEKVRSIDGDVLIFSSGHFLRVLATCWLDLDATSARCFFLGTAALSVLGYEHAMDDPVIRLWNECPGEPGWN